MIGLTGLAALVATLPLVVGAVAEGAAAEGTAADRVVRITDPRIDEDSALVVDGSYLLTTNDSGDVGRVFTLDARTGQTVGVTNWNPKAVDCEALAPAGDGKVWVGDIGDNRASRPYVTVTEVPVGLGTRTVHETSYRLVYPDGKARNAETLVSYPPTGRLYLATKELTGGELYALPAHLDAHGDNRLTAVGPVLPIATDGTFIGGGRALLIRGYPTATVYAWPSLRVMGSFALPHQRQGEGVGVEPDGTLLLSSEGLNQWVLSDHLPTALAAAVAALPPPPHPSGAGSGTGRRHLVEYGGAALVVLLVAGAALLVIRRRAAPAG